MVRFTFTRTIGAAAIRRAVARSPLSPVGRRPLSSPSTPPSEFTDSERRLYERIAEVEKMSNERVSQLRQEYGELKAEHKEVLDLYRKSVTKARDAVRETASNSAVFVGGLVLVGLATIHLTCSKGPSASTQSAAAAAEAAKAAAAAAQASASTQASLAVMGERILSVKEEDTSKKDA